MTTPERTLFDVAGLLGARELEQAFARGERAKLIDRAVLVSVLARNPGRPGTPALRALLEGNGTAALTRSAAEERFLGLLRKAQLPAPELNRSIGQYEVDFYWRMQRLIVEVDGFAFHSSLRSFEGDRRRDAWLTARGLRIMRVTWRQLVGEPEAVLVRVAQALMH